MPAGLREKAFRRYQAAELADHHLYYLFLELTQACSLNCRHCGSDCARSKQAGLTLDSWVALSRDIAACFPQVCLVLTGGEVLDWPGFLPFADHLAGLGLPWGIVTNGFRWEPGLAAHLQARGMVSATVSLDGPEAEHNWLRGHPRAFAKAVAALKDLGSLKRALNYDVVTCVHPGNLGSLDQTAGLLAGLGVPAWRLFRIFPIGRAAANPDLDLPADSTRQLLDWIGRNRPVWLRRGLSLSLSCEGWYPFKQELSLRSQPSFCRSGVNFASIRHDGSIAGCTNNHPSFNQGSVLTDRFAHVWQTRFQDHRTRPWLAESSCGHCAHVAKCQGGALHLWRDRQAPAFCLHQATPTIS